MRAASLCLLLIALLCGCDREQMAADDPSLCKSQGFAFGTPAYIKCVAALRDARRQSAISDMQRDMDQMEGTNEPKPPM